MICYFRTFCDFLSYFHFIFIFLLVKYFLHTNNYILPLKKYYYYKRKGITLSLMFIIFPFSQVVTSPLLFHYFHRKQLPKRALHCFFWVGCKRQYLLLFIQIKLNHKQTCLVLDTPLQSSNNTCATGSGINSK